MKTLPLIGATLKGFVRNWKSVLLLIIFPLLLISSVFLAFNPDGLQQIPVGVILHTNDFSLDDFEDNVASFLTITPYEKLDTCLSDLRMYNQYVCIDVTFKHAFVLTMHYDNTREPIIWEIIERIKTSVQLMQKERSKEMASNFLDKFSLTMGKVSVFSDELASTTSMIDTYIDDADDVADDLRLAKIDLQNTLNQMDNDITGAQNTRNDFYADKDEMYFESMMFITYLNNAQYYFGTLTPADQNIVNDMMDHVDGIEKSINDYNSNAEREFANFDRKLNSYSQKSSDGRRYITDINNNINRINNIKGDLSLYKNRLDLAQNEINTIEQEFSGIADLDPEVLVNPIVVQNNPAYIPDVGEEYLQENVTTKDVVRGVNLISLQTIFPLILLLIVFFLSLLISSYICLNHINSQAYERIRTIPGVSIHEFCSVFLSSLIIISVPLLCVFLLGDLIFQLPLFAHFFSVCLIVLLLASIFILLGMLLSYLVRRESIALLITTFILVLLIFFSGFVLPIERMSTGAYTLATYSPGRVALSMFSKIVFYEQTLGMLTTELGILLGWFFLMLLGAIIVKFAKRI